MDQAEEIKQKLMEMVIAAKDQRYRPFSLVKAVSDSSRIPIFRVKKALENLLPTLQHHHNMVSTPHIAV